MGGLKYNVIEFHIGLGLIEVKGTGWCLPSIFYFLKWFNCNKDEQRNNNNTARICFYKIKVFNLSAVDTQQDNEDRLWQRGRSVNTQSSFWGHDNTTTFIVIVFSGAINEEHWEPDNKSWVTEWISADRSHNRRQRTFTDICLFFFGLIFLQSIKCNNVYDISNRGLWMYASQITRSVTERWFESDTICQTILPATLKHKITTHNSQTWAGRRGRPSGSSSGAWGTLHW